MLFDGFVDAIAQAKGALPSGQIEAKCVAIGRAARIVDEGLKASLDLSGGGTLAADLADLYAYITLRLTQANLRNDARRTRRMPGLDAARCAKPGPRSRRRSARRRPDRSPNRKGANMNTHLLGYYEALEKASTDMLSAAREADWDQVVKLEGACVLLIAQLKHAADGTGLVAEEAKLKTRIMQRILVNDAEIRTLAEPWLEDLDRMLAGKARTLH